MILRLDKLQIQANRLVDFLQDVFDHHDNVKDYCSNLIYAVEEVLEGIEEYEFEDDEMNILFKQLKNTAIDLEDILKEKKQ
jgi:hypothetical protein